MLVDIHAYNMEHLRRIRTSSHEYFAHRHLLRLTEGQNTNDLIMRRSKDLARVYTQAPVTIN